MRHAALLPGNDGICMVFRRRVDPRRGRVYRTKRRGNAHDLIRERPSARNCGRSRTWKRFRNAGRRFAALRDILHVARRRGFRAARCNVFLFRERMGDGNTREKRGFLRSKTHAQLRRSARRRVRRFGRYACAPCPAGIHLRQRYGALPALCSQRERSIFIRGERLGAVRPARLYIQRKNADRYEF